jgi:hypothetical protein
VEKREDLGPFTPDGYDQVTNEEIESDLIEENNSYFQGKINAKTD